MEGQEGSSCSDFDVMSHVAPAAGPSTQRRAGSGLALGAGEAVRARRGPGDSCRPCSITNDTLP